jgi:hypothetical protein
MGDIEQQIAAFNRRVEALPATLKTAILAVLMQNAEQLAAAIRQLAEESRLTGELIASIKVTGPGSTTPAYSMGGARALLPLEVAVTAGNNVVRYAAHVEFGTVHAAAHPYFYPAVRLLWKKHRRRLNTRVRKFFKDTSA